MARKRMTDRVLTQKAPARGRVEVWDVLTPGLCIRITDKDVRTWSVMTRVDGKQRRITLGRYPALGLAAARQKAREVLTDPKAALPTSDDPERARDTVEAIMAIWLKRDQAGNRSCDETARIMRNELTAWLDRPLADLKRRDVQTTVDAIADRAPALARRFKAHLHRLCEWALRREYIDGNPVHGVDVPAPGERSRVLSDDEVRAIWQAAGHVGWPHGPITRLLFLSACRTDEIAHLAWSEIDWERREIRLPASRVKNKTDHIVPLVDQAWAIIADLPHVDGSDLVFPNRVGTSLSAWDRPKQRLDRLSGVAGWQARDVRRTVRTALDRLGCPFEVGEALLNHRSETRRGVAGTYRRYNYDREKRVWLQTWATELERIVAGGESKVVSLPVRA